MLNVTRVFHFSDFLLFSKLKISKRWWVRTFLKGAFKYEYIEVSRSIKINSMKFVSATFFIVLEITNNAPQIA